MEAGGTPLAGMFSTDLGMGLECGRGDCPTCPQGIDPPVDCFARSIMYQSTCTLCHTNGDVKSKPDPISCKMGGGGTYTGETSRSLYERVKEHLRDAKDLQKDSHIVKHWFLDHPQLQTQPKFKFKIVGKFKDCMSRQISEAVRSSLRPGSLNSKGQYG